MTKNVICCQYIFESPEAKAKYALHFDVNDPPVLEYISRCFHVLVIGFQL